MMEKRSWLWRRKPSERSPGETESSGSLSSFSGILSEGHVSSTSVDQEVTSKSSEMGEEATKSLASKLSAALASVAAKEETVRKHSKVAEEAVAGWEKAEKEASELKKQVANSVQRKLALEETVSYLDEALKECVRQLRQAREEHGHVALVKRLEHLEEENTSLKRDLASSSEELDLTIQAAETASKQHLQSINKVAKLEAECRKLKFMLDKDISNKGKISRVSSSSVEIDLMDDFIEMEKLAALEGDHKPYDEIHTKDKMELQERVRFLETDKFELKEKSVQAESTIAEIASLKKNFTSEEESRRVIERQLADAVAQCQAMSEKIEVLHGKLLQAESSLTENEVLKEKLTLAETSKQELQRQLLNVDGESKSKTEKINGLVEQMRVLSQKIVSLTAEVEQERAFSMELAVKYEQLNKENQTQEICKIEVVTAGKLAECQRTILSLGNQLKSLATIEDLLPDTPTMKVSPLKLTPARENDGESADYLKKKSNFFARSKNGTQIEI